MVFIFLISPFLSICQVYDDFTDGEIHTNPVWSGDTSLYWVVDPVNSGDGSLASGANDDGYVLSSKPDQGDAVITTVSTISEGEWIFSIADGKGWSLSSTNNYKIILMSDENDVSKLTDGNFDFNGYYLQRGSSGNDVFELYRQDGTNSTLVMNTNYPPFPDGTGAETGHTVKITRDNNSIWSIYINQTFDTIPITLRGTPVIDSTHLSSLFFGITTNIANPSNARVLYFDNLVINGSGGNLLPPTNLSIDLIAPDKMNISWTKPSGVHGTDWDGVVVFARELFQNDAIVISTDASDHNGDTLYGAGSQNINSYCIVNQNSDSDGDVVITGLSGGKDYYFIAYAYLEIAGNDNDDWSIAATEVNDTSGVQGISAFCSKGGAASAMLTWANYTVVPGIWWDEVMIVGKAGSAVDQSPLGDGSDYTADQLFGLGTEIGGAGTGNYTIYKGIGESVNVTGLINDSTYYFRAFVRYDTIWTEAGKHKDVSVIPASSNVFISEIADPWDNHNARFVELFNAGPVCVDFANDNWYLCKQINGGNWDDLKLAGKIDPGCTYVVAYSVPDFVNAYFFMPDQASSIVSGNGDDGYFLYKNGDHVNGSLVDAYGIIDQNGSGTAWDYTDSRVVRKDSIESASSVWEQQEWIILNQSVVGDMEPGTHWSSIQWQGSVSVDWNDGANWKGGKIPDSTITVIISDIVNFIPELSGTSFCYDLKIYPSGRLDIKSPGSLYVKSDVLIKSDQNATGSLITDDNNSLIYNGQIIAERYFSSNDKWHFISSPLSDCSASVFLGGYLNSWNEATQLWEHIINPSDLLNITEGYSAKLPLVSGSKAHFISASGGVNTGNFTTKPLTHTSGQDSSLNGFNFIGNPYPSSIDWDLVDIPNSVDAAIYYWDPYSGVQGMYKSYVPGIGGSGSRYVPPMHGFFIHAGDSSNGAVINFKNNARTHSGQSTTYKGSTINEILKFNVCGDTYCDATYIYFTDSAEIGFDRKYDAYKLFTFDTVVPQIYTRISGAEFSVNSLPLPSQGIIIPLGFRSGHPCVYTISLDQLSIYNPYNNIILKDLHTGELRELTKNNAYTFNHSPANDQNRFLLYINYILTDKKKDSSLSNISINSIENRILVNADSGGKALDVEIMNLLGQIIAKSYSHNQSEIIIDMKGRYGIYLVKVVCEDEIIIKKVIVN